jgi:Na+/H+ antiporter NhaD/arsenite permease-like protein
MLLVFGGADAALAQVLPEPPVDLYQGASHANTASQWVFGALLVVILLVMSLEIVDKAIVTMLGALVCLGLAYSPWFELLTHRPAGHGVAPFYISTIDWSTIGVIIGTSIFVELASRSGIFTWSALKLTRLSAGDPFRLFAFYSLLTVLFSAFLNNVTAMIIVGSLTVVSCRRLNLSALPYLFTEGILTNVGGLLTLISSLPNIIVGNTAGISFGRFFITAAPYTVLATLATVYYARWAFPEIRPLQCLEKQEAARQRVMEFDPTEAVHDQRAFWVAWGGLLLVILGFAFQSQIPILKDMGLEAVALGAATLFLLLKAPHDVEATLDMVEWSMVLFFASLFVIIGVMDHAGVLAAIGGALQQLLKLPEFLAWTLILWASAAASAVTDNIPLAALLAKIVGQMHTPPSSGLWWAVIFGANLGGNLTPIGSASTVVAMTIMKKEKLEISFALFVRKAFPFAALHLGLATIYLGALRLLGILTS